MASGKLCQGGIYRLRDCPPLDGDECSDRPVVILTPQSEIDSGENPLIAVGITTFPPDDHDAVWLPNEADCGVRVMTGLSERSWALPRWMIWLYRSALTKPEGYVPKVLVVELGEAVEERLEADDYPTFHDSTST